MAFVGRKPTNAPLTSDDIPNGIISAADLASGISGLITWQSVKTSGFTAVAGQGYPCNTTSSAFTVTLPASPSAGDTIILLDYAGTFDTNALTINPNGNKILGQTSNAIASKDREVITLTYIDSTQGWLPNSGYQEGTTGIELPYSIDFLVVAGGGGGGGNVAGGGGAGGFRTSTQTISPGTVITVTVGDGGAGGLVDADRGVSGSDSSISGSGLTTITSAGGGGGGTIAGTTSGINGGSGGGGSASSGTGGSGNTPSTSPSQGNNGGTGGGGDPSYPAGGGGGSGAVGANASGSTAGNGGNGTASSITGSSVTYAGGGGGGVSGGTIGSGGTGGGGNGGNYPANPAATAGTANLGGGGGGGDSGSSGGDGASGGKGVVILSMLTTRYSGTTTGSPTVTTSGSNTILKFNGSGSYTA